VERLQAAERAIELDAVAAVLRRHFECALGDPHLHHAARGDGALRQPVERRGPVALWAEPGVVRDWGVRELQLREWLAIRRLLRREPHAVCARGGSISAEHGVGALKREELAQRKSPVALQMMRAIKQALDPQGRLNPGRVL